MFGIFSMLFIHIGLMVAWTKAIVLSIVDPDPSLFCIFINKPKNKKNLVFCCFVTCFWLFSYENWCNCTFKKYWAKKLWKKNYILLASCQPLAKKVGSWSGSVSQWYESSDRSGSIPKCHRSTTLACRIYFCVYYVIVYCISVYTSWAEVCIISVRILNPNCLRPH